jgi:hypothetical protein
MSTPEELLRAIARDEKKRVQRCEFYDRNVCDFEFADFKVHIDPASKKYRVSAPLIRSGDRLRAGSDFCMPDTQCSSGQTAKPC